MMPWKLTGNPPGRPKTGDKKPARCDHYKGMGIHDFALCLYKDWKHMNLTCVEVRREKECPRGLK